MKKCGFTLIELLAVIVILAVIALIATPIVLNVIENTKEKANFNSAYGLLDAGRLYYSESLLNEEKASKIRNLDNLWNEIKVSGNKPATGELYVNENSDIALSVIMEDACYQKTFVGDLTKIKKEECGLGYIGNDKTAPTVTFQVLENPFNENRWAKNDFYVEIRLEDTESGAFSYQWCSTTNSTCNPDIEQPSSNGSVLILTESATNKICAIGMDNSGNKSDIICSENYSLDKTKPSANLTMLNVKKMENVDFLNGVSRNDTLSGIDSNIHYSPTMINTNIVGKTNVTYTIKDLAGNEEVIERMINVIEMDNKYFIFNAVTRTITGYDSAGPKDIVIPDQIDNVPVEKIENNAFKDKGLLSVTIGNRVLSIGASSFRNNQLTEITIPSCVTSLGHYAFQQNKINNIIMEDTMTSLGVGVFNDNQLSGEKGFIYKRNNDGSEDRTTLISYGGSNRDTLAIPSQVTTIARQAFYLNQLTSIVIPDTVTTIEQSAFSNNVLKNVKLPSALTRIENGVFSTNQLTDITIPESVIYIGDYAFSENRLIEVTIPSNVHTIQQFAFYNNQLQKAEISNRVTTIGTNAFGMNQLTNVVLPNQLVTIGISAFSNNKLVHVTIPDSVEVIDESAFVYNQLTTVVLPTNLKSINGYAFRGNKLSSVIIPASVQNIGNFAFTENQLTSVKIIGKASSTDFTTYGTAIWGWGIGYGNANIIWNAK